MRNTAQVTFFLPDEPRLEELKSLDPDRDWRLLSRGQAAWVLQTYLRLARAGLPVGLSGRLPAEGLVVFHARDKREAAHRLPRLAATALVAVRGDRCEVYAADFEILQNGRWADGRRRFFLPHWPQPGLVPRDPARGARIGRAAFLGLQVNLDAGFRSGAWRDFLRGRGIEWAADAVEPVESETGGVGARWNDYSRVDLVVAVRDLRGRGHTGKPATKLCNAWLAGVPAILGPEYAYRELRRRDLDYIEVRSLEEARAAVIRLQEEPALYRAMVENGLRRAEEFTVQAVTRRWADLLYETLPRAMATDAFRRSRRVPARLRSLWRRLARLAALRPAR